MNMETEIRIDEHVRRSLGGVARSSEELDERAMELRAHLEDAIAARVSAGADVDAAREDALQAFGAPRHMRRSFVVQDLRALSRRSLHLPWSWTILMGLDLTLHTTWYSFYRSQLAVPTIGFWTYLLVATSICFGVYWVALAIVRAGIALRTGADERGSHALGAGAIALGIALWALLPGGMGAIAFNETVVSLTSRMTWEVGRVLVLLPLGLFCLGRVRSLVRAA